MKQMFRQQGRPNVPRVGVVVTDGMSKDPAQTAMQARLAQEDGVKMYAVGVSRLIDEQELVSIASNGTTVYSAASFDQLKLVFESLVVQV